METFSPLIVDNNYDFVHSIKCSPAAKTLPPIVISTPNGIEEKILSTPYSAVFINPKTVPPQGIPIIRGVLKHRPGTPIFYLLNKNDKQPSTDELACLTIHRCITKPINYQEIIDQVISKQMGFNADALLASPIVHQQEKNSDAPITSDDNAFVPILATHFMSGSTSYFDVFVKLDSGRYIKVLQARDAFSPDRLKSYLKKGITHFFIPKAAQENYLRYCDQLASVLVNRKDLSASVKWSQTMNYGEETLSYLANHGVNQTTIHHGRNFAKTVTQLVHQLDTANHPQIDAFIKNLYEFEHGVGLSALAAMILPELGFQTDKCVQSIGLACLFHDIGLADQNKKLEVVELETLTVEEQKIFYEHPIKGAEILRELSEIPPVVIQAVEQHHERIGRTGFPHQINSGQINLVSQVIGICDEFTRLIYKTKDSPNVNPTHLLALRMRSGFSDRICNAFEKIFLRRS